jgi:hypothetical protein
MKYALLVSILFALSTFTAANPPGVDKQKQVYGSAFLEPYFEPGQEIHDAVKLRYKCQVVENQCTRPDTWKIIFMFHFFQTPGNSKGYEIQSNLCTWNFAYPHLSRRNARGEVQGLRNFAGKSSLFLSVPDNHKDRRTGARSHVPEMFPTLDQEIDGIKDLWKREHVSQLDVTGKTLTIEIARQGIAESLRGWSVHDSMPPGKYRSWMATASWGDSSYKVEFVLPDEGARYFVSSRRPKLRRKRFSFTRGCSRPASGTSKFRGSIDPNGNPFESGS